MSTVPLFLATPVGRKERKKNHLILVILPLQTMIILVNLVRNVGSDRRRNSRTCCEHLQS